LCAQCLRCGYAARRLWWIAARWRYPRPRTTGQRPENPSSVSGVRQSPRSVRHASVTETVLHSFGAYPDDGANPRSGLTYFKGTLYGATSGGGGASVCSGGCGTVYRITTSGQEKVLHRFGLVAGDGTDPEARLIVLKDTLYGTTIQGGGKGRGQTSAFSCTNRYRNLSRRPCSVRVSLDCDVMHRKPSGYKPDGFLFQRRACPEASDSLKRGEISWAAGATALAKRPFRNCVHRPLRSSRRACR
jgi:uncharacterized repeat protein (TIGR03803 family)